MEESKKHIQLPNDMALSDLEPKDLLVYVTIKRYMNKTTKEAYPSLRLISEKSGYSVGTIRKCINQLEVKGYITVSKVNKKNVYKFSDYKNFEPFSYEFLDNELLSANEKAYLLVSQQHMFKEEGVGKMSYTTRELADKINVSQSTIVKNNKSLEDKGFLTQIKSRNSSGEQSIVKIFNLLELGQAIVFTLQDHEERISENEKTLKMALKEIEALKKQLSEINNLDKEL